jgi:hypothetical protein
MAKLAASMAAIFPAIVRALPARATTAMIVWGRMLAMKQRSPAEIVTPPLRSGATGDAEMRSLAFRIAVWLGEALRPRPALKS